jgi:hypothetical protein
MKKFRIFNLIFILILSFILNACLTPKDQNQWSPSKVVLKKHQGKYSLYVNEKPFYIKGAGLEFGNMESLARHGGNSFRTWRVENGKISGKQVLDEAQKYGLMVCMGLEVARERHGFDYNDEAAVKKQFEQIKKDVLKLKDHPALLMWGIGNELNLRSKNPKVWDAVNEIAEMIHEIDGNHPTTTMLAGAGKNEIEMISERCPAIDLISFQLYGKIINLPHYIEEAGYKGAYIVSEWGATGHWEVPKTAWERPIEQNSHVKANAYFERYNKVIASDSSQCIGSFVFLWGQKQERTPTWYGMFLENGDRTEAIDIMQYLWTKNWPENRVPAMQSMTIEGKTAYDNIKLASGQLYNASSMALDPENDKLQYSWVIMKEVADSLKSDGGDFEPTPETVMNMNGDHISNEITFKAPEEGEYRLFVYVNDGNGNSATANIPFLVNN